MVVTRSFAPPPRRFSSWLRRLSPRKGRRAGRSSRLALEPLEARDLLTGAWTPVANLPPGSGTGTMLLLSDGTVMVQGGGVTNAWYRLTPDAYGSYSDGSWSALAPMHLQRLYFASNVLTDGRVLVVGGEYSGPQGQATWTHTAEIYDPFADTWTTSASFPESNFGDDPSAMLPDGRVLAGYLDGPQTYIDDPASNHWSPSGSKLRNDRSDEETWVKLPDDSILSYDVFNDGHAQRYVPSLDQWVDTGPVPVSLSGASVEDELGPAFLLPDGRALFIGATNHTALYTPATDSWSAGPDLPDGLGADDAPGAELPNGHVLFAADRVPEHSPTSLFDFDPSTDSLTELDVPADLGLGARNAYGDRMLVLPSGEVLFGNGLGQLFVYTPAGAPDPSWQPVIDQVTDNGDGSFLLTGWQINGISEGAAYGDDAEMSSNYPIVRLTDDSGLVYYATTYNWSSTGVATGDVEQSVYFQPPAGLAAGHYSLSVIANGIASDPVDYFVADVTKAPMHVHGAAVPGQTLSPPGSNPGLAPAVAGDGQAVSAFGDVARLTGRADAGFTEPSDEAVRLSLPIHRHGVPVESQIGSSKDSTAAAPAVGHTEHTSLAARDALFADDGAAGLGLEDWSRLP